MKAACRSRCEIADIRDRVDAMWDACRFYFYAHNEMESMTSYL